MAASHKLVHTRNLFKISCRLWWQFIIFSFLNVIFFVQYFFIIRLASFIDTAQFFCFRQLKRYYIRTFKGSFLFLINHHDRQEFFFRKTNKKFLFNFSNMTILIKGRKTRKVTKSGYHYHQHDIRVMSSIH